MHDKGGRPTDYDPSYVLQAEKLCNLGATDMELADFFGVHVATIYRWKNTHEEFCDAIKAGKEKADARVERSLYHKAIGYDYTEEEAIKIKVEQHKEEIEVVEVQKHQPSDTTAAIFWLKNRKPEDWRDKQEVALKGTVTVSSEPIDENEWEAEYTEGNSLATAGRPPESPC